MEKHAMTDRVCEVCKSAFSVRTEVVKRGKGRFCSKKCRGIAMQKKKVACECFYCKTIFYLLPGNVNAGQGLYCSRECYFADIHEKRQVIETFCEVCGKSFYSYPSGKRKFCSSKCAYLKLRGENSPHYRGGNIGGYRGPNWYVQRKLAYTRDGGKCQHCGAKKNKNGRKCSVHHIVKYRFYKKLYGKYGYLPANDLLNLITLCDTCHTKAERGKIPIQRPLL